MYFDCFYTHTVNVTKETSVVDAYGGIKKTWSDDGNIQVFLDTPSTDRLVEAAKMGTTVDRDLYAPYSMLIDPKWRFNFDGVTFEAAGELEDQGGQNEVKRLPLRKVFK